MIRGIIIIIIPFFDCLLDCLPVLAPTYTHNAPH